jgi:dienelactone hydrolase
MAKPGKRKYIPIFLLVFWSTVTLWMLSEMQATGFEDSVLESDSQVEVKFTPDHILFSPRTNQDSIGVLFYPGALVEPEAYAPFAKDLAEEGYTVLIQPIPFRLAFTAGLEQKAYDKTIHTFSIHPEIKKWVISGHSKGGSMATKFAFKNPELIAGMLLLGTSHPRELDLSSLSIPITKVSATEDGLASPEEIKQFAPNLPDHTNFVMIEGANHSQFGYYGFQFGAGTATISRDKQQTQLLIASLDMLEDLN